MLSVVLLLVPLPAASQTAGGVDAPTLLAEVPIAYEEGRLIVDVVAGTGAPLRFIFDTAAQLTLLPDATTRKLATGAPAGVAQAHGAGGAVQLQLVTLDTLRLGSLVFTGVTAVAGHPGRQPGGTHYDGVLGMDLFRPYDLELDIPGRRLRIYEGDSLVMGDDAERFQSGHAGGYGKLVMIAAELGGHPVRGLLDTGFRDLAILNWDAAAATGIAADDSRLREFEGGTRGMDGSEVRTMLMDLDGIVAGAVRLPGGEARIADLPVFTALGMAGNAAMLIGVKAIEQCRVRIAYPRALMELCAPATRP